MEINVINESKLSEAELDALFLQRRKKFQSARTPEEIQKLYRNILREFPKRYRYSTQEYAKQGVEDVLLRCKWLKKVIPKTGLIADLGCGDGYFVLQLASNKRKVIGVDMLKERVEKAKNVALESNKNVFFISSLVENLPLENNYFDCVILSHMLEHVYNPSFVLNEAVRITKNKGLLVVVVPTTIGRDPTHIRYIKPNKLEKMLENFGNISKQHVVGTKGIGYILQIRK